MRTSKRQSPTVNAGSMADIAFLLLIFFLVTTTISADKGILRKLPADCPPNQDCTKEINDRNVLNILLNSKNQIMVDEEITDISILKDKVIAFIDNNGNSECDYCNGSKLSSSSDSPNKAIISLKTDAFAEYKTFINIQDKISKAYYELREAYALKTFNTPVLNLSKEQLIEIKQAYPFILSEAETDRNQL